MSEHPPKKWLLFVLLGVLVSLVISANMWKSQLTVQRVIVEGNRIVETSEIVQLAHVSKNASLYDLDLRQIEKDIVSHHFIKNVVVERDLPATIRIRVGERTPLAIVNGVEILYLDEDGMVLPHSISRELFDLPVLTGLSPNIKLAVGKTIKDLDVREALSILSTARVVSKEIYHLISEIRLRDGGDIVMYAAERGVPIIFGRGEIPSKLVRLEAFWNEMVHQEGAENLQYVDLRYEDQVIVRWNTSQTKGKKI